MAKQKALAEKEAAIPIKKEIATEKKKIEQPQQNNHQLTTLKNDLKQEVIQLWHKDRDITTFKTTDCIVLPGGFSYGDYLRCGAIARFSPMMQSVIDFANKGGKVLGVCNGFQILCESGLLPGALLRNADQQFVCKNVFIKCSSFFNKTLSELRELTKIDA